MPEELTNNTDGAIPKKPSGKQMGQKNLSALEKKFIDEHWSLPGWTDERIAKELDRGLVTIEAYRKRKGYSKSGNKPNIRVKTEEGEIVEAKKLEKTANLSDDHRIKMYKDLFKLTSRYRSIKDKLIPADLEFFLDQWAIYHLQFEDMTATEEDNLELIIMMKLRMDGNQSSRKQVQLYQIELEDQIKALSDENGDLDVEVEAQRRLREMILSNNRMDLELNKEYREMADRFEKLLRAMSGTREQREQKQKIGGDTFLSLVKSFNDRDKRKDMGKYNEFVKIAAKKKEKEWKQPYIFADNNVEPIIMAGEDYKKEVKSEKDSTNNGN